jgi:hypothetical protein
MTGSHEVSGSIPLISTKKACFRLKMSLFYNLFDVFDISPLFCAPSGCIHFSHTPAKIE